METQKKFLAEDGALVQQGARNRSHSGDGALRAKELITNVTGSVTPVPRSWGTKGPNQIFVRKSQWRRTGREEQEEARDRSGAMAEAQGERLLV